MELTENSFSHPDQFVCRHNGSNARETGEMLAVMGFKSLDELVDAAVPKPIRSHQKLNLPPAKSEFEALAELKRIASANKVFRSFIGQGYYDCITPAVIQRNVLETPVGTPSTPRIRPKSPRAASKPSSISRPWSAT